VRMGKNVFFLSGVYRDLRHLSSFVVIGSFTSLGHFSVIGALMIIGSKPQSLLCQKVAFRKTNLNSIRRANLIGF